MATCAKSNASRRCHQLFTASCGCLHCCVCCAVHLRLRYCLDSYGRERLKFGIRLVGGPAVASHWQGGVAMTQHHIFNESSNQTFKAKRRNRVSAKKARVSAKKDARARERPLTRVCVWPVSGFGGLPFSTHSPPFGDALVQRTQTRNRAPPPPVRLPERVRVWENGPRRNQNSKPCEWPLKLRVEQVGACLRRWPRNTVALQNWCCPYPPPTTVTSSFSSDRRRHCYRNPSVELDPRSAVYARGKPRTQ